MKYKYSLLLEESWREISRNRVSLLFSGAILIVLSTIYFVSLGYSWSVFQSQQKFYSQNPVYAFLSDAVTEDDESFLFKYLSEEFNTPLIKKVNVDDLDQRFWKELGVTRQQIAEFGFTFPKVVEIKYDRAISVLQINSIIEGFQKRADIVRSFIYNDEGFKTSNKLWKKVRAHALFYIFSSVLSLIFFTGILLAFLVLNKRKNLKILDYLGASDAFALVPLFVYSFVAFLVSGLVGFLLAREIKSIFNITSSLYSNIWIFLSYMGIFFICCIFFSFFAQRVMRDGES